MDSVAKPEITQQLVPALPPDSLMFARDPKIVLAEAERAAKALKKVIDSKPKQIKFNGEVYLENEDWLTVARFYGVTSRIRRTTYVQYGDPDVHFIFGFEAVAEAFHVERGEVISTAESMCLSDEPTWAKKPLFQLRSMAQTRASSRVLRQVFGWVVVLAGYKPTPAEEMLNGAPSAGATPLHLCKECGDDIWTEQEVHAARQKFGTYLCRICFKAAVKKEQDGANRDLTGELKKSIEMVQNQKQPHRAAGD